MRVISLVLDQNLESVRTYVLSNKLTEFEYYNALVEDCNAVQDLKVQRIPYIVIVDVQGNIVYCGGPRLDIEKIVTTLLSGGTI